MWFHIILFVIYFSSNDGYEFDEDSEIEILTHIMYENLKAFPHYEISKDLLILVQNDYFYN